MYASLFVVKEILIVQHVKILQRGWSSSSGGAALGGGSDRTRKRRAAGALHSKRMEGSNTAARVRPLARTAVRGSNGEAHVSNHGQSQAAAPLWMPSPWCMLNPFFYIKKCTLDFCAFHILLVAVASYCTVQYMRLLLFAGLLALVGISLLVII